jgi:hypothetical protein
MGLAALLALGESPERITEEPTRTQAKSAAAKADDRRLPYCGLECE